MSESLVATAQAPGNYRTIPNRKAAHVSGMRTRNGYGYGYPGYGYGYGYPAYSYARGYYGGYTYGYHPVVRHAYVRRHWRY
jgi:hypothetical protein